MRRKGVREGIVGRWLLINCARRLFCLFDFGDIENGGLAGKPRFMSLQSKKESKARR